MLLAVAGWLLAVPLGLAVAGALCADGPEGRPDGVFVANDIMAFGVIDGLRRAGVAIPGDTSLVGFDDLPQARWMASSKAAC